mmetsp:Transcript_10657/g.35364  ORF Transcript_10657/g.35364 Transcript_10657/m.35364 type:complete len:112 (-) Transcript_10657:1923-2258(-)
MLAYSPCNWTNSACVPHSATAPAPRTRILVHFAMVPKRCAMEMEVRVEDSLSSAAWICDSVFESSAEVASSRRTTGGFFMNMRAMATRCFSPPESLRPRSPTTVSHFKSRS